jgi:hypothetical protein
MCDVSDYVFSDFHDQQREKVYATTRSEYGEVWWFYPSEASEELDRYVIYNYREGTWAFGNLARTADVDHTPFDYPIAVDTSGDLWEHEAGTVRSGMTPYVESGPVELGDGTALQQVLSVYPDETSLGDVSATFYAQFYPTGTETSQAVTLANPTNVRLTGRQMRVKFTEVNPVDWRIGHMRVMTVPAGQR